jgi:septum formation protein
MLSPFTKLLEKLTIVLASQSPRRSSIFRENLGLTFEVVVSGFAEDIDKTQCTSPTDYVMKTARMKAVDVTTLLSSSGRFPDLIVSADTVVVQGNSILEKPGDVESAKAMIRQLSGTEHSVLTSVTIACNRNSFRFQNDCPPVNEYTYHSFVEETKVKFISLSEEVIDGYVESGEPMDKAGGYGIQSLGASLVQGVDGCYFNVVGFPVHRFCIELTKVLETHIER